MSGLFGHFDLPEPTLQVHACKVSGTNHALHGLLHTRQGVGILSSPGIEATKVNAKPERPILLSHQHHGIAPWQLGGSDGATVQHLLYMLVHLIHQGRGDAPKPLLEWLILHELDDMLRGIRASYFIRLQREDMVEFQQQRHCLLSQIRWPFFEAIQPIVLLQGGEEEVLSLLSREFNRLWPVGVLIV